MNYKCTICGGDGDCDCLDYMCDNCNDYSSICECDNDDK